MKSSEMIFSFEYMFYGYIYLNLLLNNILEQVSNLV